MPAMDKMQSVAMSGLSKVFRSDFAERHGLRPLIERQTYSNTKRGFSLLSKFQQKQKAKQGPALLPAPKKQVFDLSLSDEQQQLSDMIESFALEQLRPNAYEADKTQTISEDIWSQWLELGANYMAVPESYGGMASEDKTITLAILTQKLAQGDLSMAYSLLSSVSVVNCIERWGSDSQKKHYFDEFLNQPETKASMACFEQGLNTSLKDNKAKAKKTQTGYKLNAVKAMVPNASQAKYFVVSAKLSGALRLFIVPSNAPGIRIKTTEAMGLKACQLSQVSFEQVELGKNQLLHGDFDAKVFSQLNQLSWCALSVGCGQAVVDYVTQYANERTAFGEPISQRQSVAFAIADMALELEAMRLMFWRACNQIDLGLDATEQTRLANLYCTEKGMMIGTQGVQLVGGHGFTKEHPVERWYRDIRAMAIAANAQL